MVHAVSQRWVVVLVTALAIAGLLAMHGFEAGFAGAERIGHVELFAVSPLDTHIAHGGCDLDVPETPAEPVPAACADTDPELLLAAPVALASLEVPPLANRAALTAFSLLRV